MKSNLLLKRLSFFAMVAVVDCVFLIFQVNGYGAPMDDQIKDLQAQILLLQQQMQLATLQQTQQAVNEQAVLTALKNQVNAQNDLDKATAQGAFAKWAGTKAGLDSVGAPPGKEGKLTITTGTAGTLLLKLKGPMLSSLYNASTEIAVIIKNLAPKISGGVVIATDAELQAALQSNVSKASIKGAADALSTTVTAVQGTGVSVAFFVEAAAAGLFLRTLTDFAKFFRVDRTDTVFDSGEEANQVLHFFVENRLSAKNVPFISLSDVLPDLVVETATDALNELNSLRSIHDKAAALLASIDKTPLVDPNRPAADLVDRLRSQAAIAKEMLDTLHPASKPESFWAYVKGLYNDNRMSNAGKYLARIAMNAKAQTIQVTESRTWLSDKIYGSANVQVDYRIVDGEGALLVSEIMLITIDNSGAVKAIYLPPRTV
jgi:hypothetical protein